MKKAQTQSSKHHLVLMSLNLLSIASYQTCLNNYEMIENLTQMMSIYQPRDLANSYPTCIIIHNYTFICTCSYEFLNVHNRYSK
jgi:hypothetical protein